MAEQRFGALCDRVRAPAGAETPSGIRPTHGGLFDADGNPLLISEVGLLPSTTGALNAIRQFFGARWQPGDVALTNDIDAGAINACEISLIAPIHSGAMISGWSVVRGYIPDFGGWEPGGFSPQAVDRWAEGARLEPVKVIAVGRYRREVTDLLQLNSRTPASTLASVQTLADAAVALGRAYARHSAAYDEAIAALRATERQQAALAIAALGSEAALQKIDVVVPWSNEQFGAITVHTEKSGDFLRVALSGPAIAKRPINLGPYAAQDIVMAAVAAACGLDSRLTAALADLVAVSVGDAGLLAAPLPATAGLGRHTTGMALYRATAAALGLAGEHAESSWQNYRDRVCGFGFDWQTGRLAAEAAAKIRARQREEVVA